MSGRKIGVVLAFGMLLMVVSRSASAQVTPDPSRDKTWQTVTGITMVGAGVTQLVMPRIFYSDPEVTQGWKGRWHVSVLAPVLTLTALTAANEFMLKDALASPRPGCDDTNQGTGHCATYGSLSTHMFGAASALGHGAAVWFFDMTKYSGGRFNGASFAGNVILPFLFAGVTGIGRQAGNWESTGQIIAGGVAGLGIGFLTGMTYALMAKPECGYTGSMVCW